VPRVPDAELAARLLDQARQGRIVDVTDAREQVVLDLEIESAAVLRYIAGQSRCRRPVLRKNSSTRRRSSVWKALSAANFRPAGEPRAGRALVPSG
jgi:hypothetical protein